MNRIAAIASREFTSFFRLPVGWVVIALYMLLTGVIFLDQILVPGEPASLRHFFGVSRWLLLFVMPAVSMRLISEEMRTGTLESLMTSPVTDTGIVLGKFAGATLFLLAVLAPTAVYPVVLFAVSDPAPDPGPILAGYLSVVLLGGLFLSVGTLVSSLTANQTLAFLGTFLFLLILLWVSQNAGRLPAPVAPLFGALMIEKRIDDFAKGVVDTSNIVFFLAGSAWFLVLAVVAVQSRRWR